MARPLKPCRFLSILAGCLFPYSAWNRAIQSAGPVLESLDYVVGRQRKQCLGRSLEQGIPGIKVDSESDHAGIAGRFKAPVYKEISKGLSGGIHRDPSRALKQGITGKAVLQRTQSEALFYPKMFVMPLQHADIIPARDEIRILLNIGSQVEQLLAGPG